MGFKAYSSAGVFLAVVLAAVRGLNENDVKRGQEVQCAGAMDVATIMTAFQKSFQKHPQRNYRVCTFWEGEGEGVCKKSTFCLYDRENDEKLNNSLQCRPVAKIFHGGCIPQEPGPNNKCWSDRPCTCRRHKAFRGVWGHVPLEKF